MVIENDSALWLMAGDFEELKEDHLILEIEKFDTHTAKSGKEIPIMICDVLVDGKPQCRQVSLWGCWKDKCIKEWGTEEEKWLKMKVKAYERNGKIQLDPIGPQ